MKLRLLAFASASQALGSTELDYDLDSQPTGAPTVGDLKADLTIHYPQVEALWERLAVAVNGQIVSDAELLSEGTEVALLPPVSGG